MAPTKKKYDKFRHLNYFTFNSVRNNRVALFFTFINWIIFILFFLYFAILNKYHLHYLEQTQLFLFNSNYFFELLSKPGGLMEYLNGFFIQFFRYSTAGAFLLTLLGIGFFHLSSIIFKKLNLRGIFFPIIPVFLLGIVHSDYKYSAVYSLSVLFALAFFAGYISIKNSKKRYFSFLIGWPLLYFALGGFSLLFMLLCCIYECFICPRQSNKRFLFVPLPLALLLPYLSWRFIYNIPLTSAWLTPVLNYKSIYYYIFLAFPLAALIIIVLLKIKSKNIHYKWNLKNYGIGVILAGTAIYFLLQTIYDPKTEQILGMDYCAQQKDWTKVLELSAQYPGNNRLVIYFTNIALSQTGQLSNKLFNYPQIGSDGFRLKWKRNKFAPLFGGEVFYHLHYHNEAFRWAFESMVSNGNNPRSFKRLIQTSIATGNYALADKYLSILGQSLFYKQWAKSYQRKLLDLKNGKSVPEFDAESKFRVHDNFTSDLKGYNLQLQPLLKNAPDNQIAFEYYLASLLMNKNIEAIIEQLNRLKDFKYQKIPTHIEEALLLYMNKTSKQVNTGNYQITDNTIKRFENFALTFAKTYNSSEKTALLMQNEFGNTFWYHFYFNR